MKSLSVSIYLSLSICLCLSVSVYGGTVTTFNDSSTAKNITFLASGNQSVYIEIPKQSYIKNSYLNISGFEIIAEQDAANATLCSGNWSPTFTCANSYDSNWETLGRGVSYTEGGSDNYTVWVIENFTIPSWTNSALWTAKFSTSEMEPFTHLEILNITCHNGTDWINIYNKTGSGAFTSTFSVPIGCLSGNTAQINTTMTTIDYDQFVYWEGKIRFSSDPLENVSLDISGDGGYDWSYSIQFNHTNNRTSNLTSEVISFLDSCYPDVDGYCVMPLVAHSDSKGIMELTDIYISYDSAIAIDNCTNSTNILLTANIYDEQTVISENATLEAIIDLYENGFYVGNYSFRFEGNSTYSVCSYYNGVYQIDSMMQYFNDDSLDRNYYLRNATCNTSDPTEITLYLSNDTENIRFEVYDNTYLPKEEAIVNIEKLDIANNIYFTVTMVESDFEGEGKSHLEIGDEWYRFTVTDYSVSPPEVYSFSPKQPYYDSDIGYVTIQLVLGESEYLTYMRSFAYNCSRIGELNESATVRCIFTNTEGLHSTICLNIYNNTAGGMVNYSSTCTSDVSATLYDNLPNATGIYFYQFLYTDSSTGITYLVDSGEIVMHILRIVKYPLFFMYVSMTFVGMLALLTIHKPDMAIIFVPLGLAVSGKIFTIHVGMGAISAFVLLGLFVISRLFK